MQHAATGYARWLLSTCPLLERTRFPGEIQEQFERTGRTIDPAVLNRLLDVTGGHPYATQELWYFLWEATPEGGARADAVRYEVAATELLRSEHAHFGLIWEKAAKAQRLVLQALARDPGRQSEQSRKVDRCSTNRYVSRNVKHGNF